jgi:hypothetical protein
MKCASNVEEWTAMKDGTASRSKRIRILNGTLHPRHCLHARVVIDNKE